MAPEEVVDEFEQVEAVAVQDSATSLTNALVFMTTFLLLVGIIVAMYAMKKYFHAGLLA
jgi:hypothetical protein